MKEWDNFGNVTNVDSSFEYSTGAIELFNGNSFQTFIRKPSDLINTDTLSIRKAAGIY